ncbi:MAG: penicillin-binding transpeptidase domain-containing protein [Desulfobacterales bacterium]
MKFHRPHKPSADNRQRPSWRDYQSQLKHRRGRFRLHRRFLLAGAGLTLAVLLSWWTLQRDSAPPSSPAPTAQAAVQTAGAAMLSKTDVQDLLMDRPLSDLLKKRFFIQWGEQKLAVDPSIDPALQLFLTKRLYERTSRYIAIVVMEGTSGRILALVGFDKHHPGDNPCLANRFPAASIFKIVTAGAAMEHCHLSSRSALSYNGAKHTLYKSQLKNINNRYTHQTTLAASFAQSVNPVFGKLGRHCLGQEALAQYADAFGFNRAIPFELPVSPSRAPVTADPYQWAEMASGFNRQTVISPLHGALLAAVVPSEGILLEPTIVDRITDASGQVLYRSAPAEADRAVTPQTAREMERLMQETVRRGTARKIFRRRAKDRVLSQLEIGGKTGSIDNAGHDARYDWFVGFARHSRSREVVAVAVVVAHEKYIGRRAGEYARMAFQEYFRRRIADDPQAS